MQHPIHRVTSFEQTAPFTLRVEFDDGLSRVIDFGPILHGELLGPLRDPTEFARVKLDAEVKTLVWPSGADFDPAVLHDWPEHEAAFRAAAKRWNSATAAAYVSSRSPSEMSDGEEIDDDTEEREMGCETAARMAIEHAAASIEKDEIRGVIYMDDGEDHRFNPLRTEFSSWEDVRHSLLALGESEWVNYVPFDGGEPVFSPSVDGYVESVMADYGVERFFDSISPPDEGEELIDAHDLIAHRAGLVVQVDLAEINDELIHYLAKHPEKMHDLHSRTFEQLIAEIFKDKGYDVELTPKTKDGGFDIRAFRRDDVGTCLTLVECKRYAPKNPVSVEIVRGLYGVSRSEGATNGVIATTSRFTKGAQSFQAQNKYSLHLADFDHIRLWLAHYKKGRSNA
jgi:hypothetical protein